MKNVLVIGGSSGIGESLVQLLEKEGCNVMASYNTHMKNDTKNVRYFQFNATEDQLNLDQLPDELHGLVYCPGSIKLKPFHRFSEQDFIDDYKLQVIGATNIIQQVLPKLKASGAASVVMFSTVAVQQGFVFHSQVAASKGAIEGLTRALSAELAPSIRVNAIAPSLTQTPLAERLLNTPDKIEKQSATNPLKRVGKAQDIAEAASFLLSPKASWITGQIIHIDGGYSSIK